MAVLDAIIERAQTQSDIAAIWLYGSRARGDNHDASDYDLAVAYTNWLEDPIERRLRPELQEQTWQDLLGLPGGVISVVDLAIVPIPLGMSILLEGKILLDRLPQIRMVQESRITGRWEHDYLFHYQRYGG